MRSGGDLLQVDVRLHRTIEIGEDLSTAKAYGTVTVESRRCQRACSAERPARARLGAAPQAWPGSGARFDRVRVEPAGAGGEPSEPGPMITVEPDSAEVSRWPQTRRCTAYQRRFGLR